MRKNCIDNKNHDFFILHSGGYSYEDKGNYIHRRYAKNYIEYLGCKKCGLIKKPKA